MYSLSPSGSNRSVPGGSSAHMAPQPDHSEGSTSDSESSSASSASPQKPHDSPVTLEDMGHKSKETGKHEGSSVEGGRRVIPAEGSVKRARLDGNGFALVGPPERCPNTSDPLSVPGDAQFRFSKVVDSVEAGVDPAIYKLVHGFWVPSALSVTYRDIVERGGGHMVKEGLLDMRTLCYMNKNLLEVADQLARVEVVPLILVFCAAGRLLFVPQSTSNFG